MKSCLLSKTYNIKWKHDWENDWREYDVLNIFGHDHNPEVQSGRNYLGIDIGCVYGDKLTAVELGSMIEDLAKERDM